MKRISFKPADEGLLCTAEHLEEFLENELIELGLHPEDYDEEDWFEIVNDHTASGCHLHIDNNGDLRCVAPTFSCPTLAEEDS